MSESKGYISYPDEMGTIHIADEVLAVVAASAALEVEGVSSLAANLQSDIAELMGRKVYSKGVRLLVANGQVMVEISILIQYGYVIPDVARKVQEVVMSAVTNTSGMEVSQVNVQVAGISFQKKVHKEKQQ